MTTFNTGKPVGSSDPRDLYDNAENLDTLINSPDKMEHPDRLGMPRKTWHAIEEDFQNFLLESGYQDIGAYAAGLEITARNQIFVRSGEYYRAAASLNLPYTTTGDWVTEGSSFVSVGDATLRQDLAAGIATGRGALKVGGSVIYVAAVADLLALPAAALIDGQAARIALTGRAGDFVWKTGDQSANVSADPLGIVYVAPSAATSGISGCWERRFPRHDGLSVAWGGASPSAANNISAIQGVLDYASALGYSLVTIPDNVNYKLDQTGAGAVPALTVPSGVKLKGAGLGSVLTHITDATDAANTTVYWDTIRLEDCVDSHVSDLKIVGQGGLRNNCAAVAIRGPSSKNSTIQRVRSQSPIASSFVVESAQKCHVHDCQSVSAGRHGVYFSSTTNSTAMFNDIDSPTLEGLVNRNAPGCKYIHNEVNGGPYGFVLAQTPSGFSDYDYHNLVVSFNTFGGFAHGAIYGLGEQVRDSTFSDNQIDGAGGDSSGIILYRGRNLKITDNQVKNAYVFAMDLLGIADSLIEGNSGVNCCSRNATSVVGPRDAPIVLRDYTDPSTGIHYPSINNRVRDNSLRDNNATARHQYGVAVWATTGAAENGDNRIGRNDIAGRAVRNYLSEPATTIWDGNQIDAGFHYNALAAGVAGAVMLDSGEINRVYITKRCSLVNIAQYYSSAITAGNINMSIRRNGTELFILAIDSVSGQSRISGYEPERYVFNPGDYLSVVIYSSADLASTGGNASCRLSLIS